MPADSSLPLSVLTALDDAISNYGEACAHRERNRVRKAVRNYAADNADVRSAHAALLHSLREMEYEAASKLRLVRADLARVEEERDRWKERAERFAPGRVERHEPKVYTLAFRIDESTIAYAASPRGVVNDALDACQKQLFDALPNGGYPAARTPQPETRP